MLTLILRRIGIMLLTMLAMSFSVFVALETNPDGIALKARGQFSTMTSRASWLVEEGYYVYVTKDDTAGQEVQKAEGRVLYEIGAKGDMLVVHPPGEGVTYPQKRIADMLDAEYAILEPVRVALLTRYGRWLARFAVGDFGQSYRFKVPVSDVLWGRVANTGILAGLVLLLMIPLSLFLGVMAGIREGSIQDRAFSLISIVTTSIPEFASAVLFVAIFTFWLDWLPGTSSMISGFEWNQMIMPVSVLVLYSSGYIARITRASMAEVMRSSFIRTALLKGLPYRQVIIRHAMRNALITPVTVIMLQIPWLLSGVIVVEYFFAYKGFGSLLWEAANNTDPYLIEACAMVAVVVVVVTQLIADIIYTYINPRIRFQ
ncbi:MAG: ABC transporter permease [Gammaproteobacteria bacterium WSBS_2016_MAG_OTU1]